MAGGGTREALNRDDLGAKMAGAQAPPPPTKHDLYFCSTSHLAELAYIYFEDKEALALIVAELEDRGIDPYA